MLSCCAEVARLQALAGVSELKQFARHTFARQANFYEHFAKFSTVLLKTVWKRAGCDSKSRDTVGLSALCTSSGQIPLPRKYFSEFRIHQHNSPAKGNYRAEVPTKVSAEFS